MHLEEHRWWSPHLGREMALTVAGHGGARVLVFPTTMGTHREWPDRRMHLVLADHLEHGWVQLFCLDQVHDESWYGKHLHPADRARRHLQYDAYVHDEVLPFTGHLNPTPFVIAVGASFGAYHAACFGLRHPRSVQRIVAMSGLFDIKQMTGGWSDEHVYACNPFDFMRHEWDPARLAAFRAQDIVLPIGRDDPNFGNCRDFSALLWEKGIGNALRTWDGHAHDWPYWERMIRLYLRGHD